MYKITLRLLPNIYKYGIIIKHSRISNFIEAFNLSNTTLKFVECEICSLMKMNYSTYKVAINPNQPFLYSAGQYIRIEPKQEGPHYYSIATHPGDSRLELHIKTKEENCSNTRVIKSIYEMMKKGEKLKISKALGKRLEGQSQSPLTLFIAGGSGYSQSRSIIRDMIYRKDHKNKIHLLWFVNNDSDLYDHENLVELSKNNDHFSYEYIVKSNIPHSSTHQLLLRLEETSPDSGSDIHICGNPNKTRSIRNLLQQRYSISTDNILSNCQ